MMSLANLAEQERPIYYYPDRTFIRNLDPEWKQSTNIYFSTAEISMKNSRFDIFEQFNVN